MPKPIRGAENAEIGCRIGAKSGADFRRNHLPISTEIRCRFAPIFAELVPAIQIAEPGHPRRRLPGRRRGFGTARSAAPGTHHALRPGRDIRIPRKRARRRARRPEWAAAFSASVSRHAPESSGYGKTAPPLSYAIGGLPYLLNRSLIASIKRGSPCFPSSSASWRNCVWAAGATAAVSFFLPTRVAA
jgi:hypothetical protein